MADKTLLQFGSAQERAGGGEPSMKVCATCNSRFSGDARFCPFDGAALGVTLQAERDPLISRVVDGRYEVLDVIGEGGMGTVYRVQHKQLGRQFALKALKRAFAHDKELASRFIQEAKAAAAIGHPGLVQITDFGQLAEGQPYFTMELLEGEPLSAIIAKGGPLPAAQAARSVRQLAEALGAAHAAGVIHRDLKPDNIHVGTARGGSTEVVKVLDFGLAKVAGASKLTRKGMVFGTPHYMSPEQASGETIDNRADIYALGIVMYEMFTGRVPFEADSYMGVLSKHMYMDPLPPSQLIDGTEELGALEDATLRCLEKKPEKRFANMRDLVGELDRIAALTGTDEATRLARKKRIPPENVLADELEVPTADELTALERAGVRTGARPVGTAVAIGGGLLFAATLVFAWVYLGGDAQPVVRAQPAVSGVVPTPVEAPPETPETPEPEVTPVADGELETAARPAPKPPSVRAVPRPAPRPAPPSTTPKRPPPGRGEIVNPWAD